MSQEIDAAMRTLQETFNSMENPPAALVGQLQVLHQQLSALQISQPTRSEATMASGATAGTSTFARPVGQFKLREYTGTGGENFLAFRARFRKVVHFNGWTEEQAKDALFASMAGTALESILDIDIDHFPTAEGLAQAYQERFLPASRSALLGAQFQQMAQLPGESVQRLHSRLRAVFFMAYAQSERSQIHLIERYVDALADREVQNHVRRRNPKTYNQALEFANEETAYNAMDKARHTPGGIQQPLATEGSFVASIDRRRPFNPPARPNRFKDLRDQTRSLKQNDGRPNTGNCFYCGSNTHHVARCRTKLNDLLNGRLKEGWKKRPQNTTSGNGNRVRFGGRVAEISAPEQEDEGAYDLKDLDDATVAALLQESDGWDEGEEWGEDQHQEDF